MEDDDAPSAFETPAVHDVARATEPAVTATPTPAPSSTPTPEPQRLCRSDPDAHDARLQALSDDIEAALASFEGEWGFAFIDLDCGSTVLVNPEYVQYTASAGKFPFLVAALRAVEAGEVELEVVQDDLELVFRTSDDLAADAVAAMVSPEEVREVFAIAGVSEASRFVDSWRNLSMTALDLARVWEALLRGRLLGPSLTEYVLELAAKAEIPEEYTTFPDPSSWDEPELRYGQKAGYYVSDGVPYFFVGAGYLVPRDGSSQGFVAVLLATTEVEDLLDPARRQAFPIVVEYAQQAVAELGRR
ncbi:MAG: hypothetical protein Kow0010_12310 [Dehalococcoidia bacterium]